MSGVIEIAHASEIYTPRLSLRTLRAGSATWRDGVMDASREPGASSALGGRYFDSSPAPVLYFRRNAPSGRAPTLSAAHRPGIQLARENIRIFG